MIDRHPFRAGEFLKLMTHKAKNFIRELQPSEITEKPALIFPVKQDWKIFDDGKGETLLPR